MRTTFWGNASRDPKTSHHAQPYWSRHFNTTTLGTKLLTHEPLEGQTTSKPWHVLWVLKNWLVGILADEFQNSQTETVGSYEIGKGHVGRGRDWAL